MGVAWFGKCFSCQASSSNDKKHPVAATAISEIAGAIANPYAADAATDKIGEQLLYGKCLWKDASEKLRATHYPELDKQGHVYVDYTGGSLASQQQIGDHHLLLQATLAGNTHSSSPASAVSTAWIETARCQVLQFFNADNAIYQVIFTPNASAALKLVGESYPFRKGTTFLVSEDNHNSVNGIQCFAQKKGAAVKQAPLTAEGDMRLDSAALTRMLGQDQGLFAYPGQSNLTGMKHCLGWISVAQARGWHVLLDAAALVPSSRLDLVSHSPDFVCCSFYKMFGWPTGVGCLLARRKALAVLAKPWFAGGTVEMVYPGLADFDMLPANDHARYEDGTLNYLALPAVTIGLRHLEAVGIDTINERIQGLAGWLLEKLCQQRHSNGTPLVKMVGPVSMRDRGANLAFILLSSKEVFIPCPRVEAEAIARNISLRTGCMCNPGAVWRLLQSCTAHQLSGWLKPGATLSHLPPHKLLTIKEAVKVIKQCPLDTPGVVRVSFGIASVPKDAEAVLQLVRAFLDI